MNICMDARKIRDLGVGTYIRNLLDRFREMDTEHRFLVLLDPGDAGSVTPVQKDGNQLQPFRKILPRRANFHSVPAHAGKS